MNVNEIEIRLLQSLRNSNLRDDFNTQARASNHPPNVPNHPPNVPNASPRSNAPNLPSLPNLPNLPNLVAAESNEPLAERPHVGQWPAAPRARVDLLYGELSDAVIGAAIQVHRWLGPGQLESTYQRALGKELAFCGVRYRAQVPITSLYRGEAVGEFFADFIVEDKIILELKVVSRILAVHRAQVNSYLHATGLQLGLLINFYVPVLHMGVKRVLP
ncbi:MAG: GxxExxY protein [Kofleriaceae bacterium]